MREYVGALTKIQCWNLANWLPDKDNFPVEYVDYLLDLGNGEHDLSSYRMTEINDRNGGMISEILRKMFPSLTIVVYSYMFRVFSKDRENSEYKVLSQYSNLTSEPVPIS